MSKFEQRVESKIRIIDLEKKFMNTIETFSKDNTGLTMNEVAAVMLKMITQFNDKEMREDI
jgi:hypothetical protein